jgi:hypothetical protein
MYKYTYQYKLNKCPFYRKGTLTLKDLNNEEALKSLDELIYLQLRVESEYIYNKFKDPEYNMPEKYLRSFLEYVEVYLVDTNEPNSDLVVWYQNEMGYMVPKI